MPDLADGQTTQVPGSGSSVYTLKNVGGVYSCTCPAWRNQSVGIERRTCKHLKKFRGEAAELLRCQPPNTAAAPAPTPTPASPASPSSEAADEKAGPPLLLAESWDNAADLTGWWMSEKLDGVRAYWDGSQFLSRLGNRYLAPDWFVVGLPSTPLDGELWIGRKQFQRTVSVARRQDKSEHWKTLRFVVFDAPAVAEGFEQRVEAVRDLLAGGKAAYAAAHEHVPCQSVAHLRSELARVESLGGEGLMLRRPQSKYEIGRSSSLLKVKTFHDAEASVVAYEPGKGRHKGVVGALVVRLPNGTQFSVGTGLSDAERKAPPTVGQIITFRYQELSDAGVPRFPSYVGVRHDVKLPTAAQPASAQPASAQPASAHPASAQPASAQPAKK